MAEIIDGEDPLASLYGPNDLIMELGGKEIKSIYDYTAVRAELKVGEKTTISVVRKGETVKLSITPGSRE